MERTHDGRHGADCFGCRIGPGPYVAPSALPTRTRQVAAAPKPLGNSWEKGVAVDDRGLPICGANGPLGVKELADDRHRIENRLKEIKDPAYWASKVSREPAVSVPST